MIRPGSAGTPAGKSAPVIRPSALFNVETGSHDVAADRIARALGQVRVAVLDPERIVRDVHPAVIVGIGEARVGREAEREVDVAVLAGDSAVAVVALEQFLDDQLELPVDAFLLPDLLAIFGDVDRVVLGAVADLVHHGREGAFADLLEELAGLVEDLDVRRVDLVGTTRELAGDRDPDVPVLVDRGRRRGVETGWEHP